MRRVIKGMAASTLTLATAGALFGCTVEASPTVSANGEVVNQGSQALTGSVIQWVNGTYGSSCTLNANGNWSLQIVSGNPTMDHSALSVVMNNTACVLTLTALVTNESGKTTYTASSGMVLGGSYLGTASSFSSGAGKAFYGNVMMSPSNFSANPTVTILFSDNPNIGTGALTGAWATVTASQVTQSITSPNYTLDLVTGALAVTTDVNFNVETFTGTAILDSSTVTGNGYYVDQGTLVASPTFAQLDTAYSGASPTTISGGGNVTIAASALGLGAANLTSTVYRTIVVQRVVSGVPSYETFRIAFNAP